MARFFAELLVSTVGALVRDVVFLMAEFRGLA
jgi:hypothetical protein